LQTIEDWHIRVVTMEG